MTLNQKNRLDWLIDRLKAKTQDSLTRSYYVFQIESRFRKARRQMYTEDEINDLLNQVEQIVNEMEKAPSEPSPEEKQWYVQKLTEL